MQNCCICAESAADYWLKNERYIVESGLNNRQRRWLFGIGPCDLRNQVFIRIILEFRPKAKSPCISCFYIGRITADESFFTYPPSTSWADYNDPTYQPKFLDDLLMSFENTTFLSDATALCGGDTECLFDALATRDLVIGENTRVTKTGLQDDAEALCKC